MEGSGMSSAACEGLESLSYLDLISKHAPMECVSIGDPEARQPLKVYLRVRPFSKAELENNEFQNCVIIENPETVTLQAPKESSAMKNSEKGIGQSIHRFTFTRVFGPEATQSEFFEGTMREIVKTYIDGVNGLVFTYGVTNAGKTFTIQGSPKEVGILTRSLDMIFTCIRGRQYLKMDLKPHLSNNIKKLEDVQVKQEEAIKAAILASLKEETENILNSPTTPSASSSIYDLTSTSNCTSPSLLSDPREEKSLTTGTDLNHKTQSSVWVSFCEIYNEYVYDLLDTLSTSKNQKRRILRICEDQGGNSYIKDLKWINIKSTEEACKILKIGNKNRSLAFTRMNQYSSRRLSLCDLAGSERCNKAQSFGDRLKEAGNINNSLLILGKCIAALKQNQNPKMKPSYVPFRESKLTRLFQPFFCGKGKACMIVNINPCASTYDETLHVMKFSAVAKQVIQTVIPNNSESFVPRLVGKDGKPLMHFDANISAQELPDMEISVEEEVDITIMSHEDLLKTTENLKERLVMEKQSKLLLEVQIRKEMAEAMFQQLLETEQTWSKRLEDVKESYEDKLESKFEMYKEAIKKHAYMCAMEQIEDHYVPIEEFIAEQEKVEDRDRKILQLKLQLGEQSDGLLALESPSPIVHATEGDVKPDLKYEEMQRTKEQLQRKCEEQDELIKSLKFKIQKLNENVQEVNEACSKTSEENSTLKHMLMLKDQEMRGLQNWAKRVLELETTVSSLQEELDETKKQLWSEDLKRHKPKRGLLANLKSTVAGTSKTPISKTVGKFEECPTPSKLH
ncbi:kinesin-like protein KIF20A isoform X2 [Alligator mississippiensis]|uniref:kinesin-like protein KIF20A isoform X2 n=1 Tax=Alligator mississippiensis TaxID=8496 RepID=UPI0009073E04|nr:kinesin-like protein KIF20A isoform X2 [Alligator mississippiensis]